MLQRKEGGVAEVSELRALTFYQIAGRGHENQGKTETVTDQKRLRRHDWTRLGD